MLSNSSDSGIAKPEVSLIALSVRMPKARTLWQDAWLRLRRDRMALLGAAVVIALSLVALLAPWVARYDPWRQYREGLQGGFPVAPNAMFLLGTDNLGRDIFSRLVWGARISLSVGVLGNVLAVLIGTFLGAAAGLARGWVESVVMRFTDVVMGFPVFLLAVALITILRPGVGTVILVIGLVYWTYLARIVYNKVTVLREMEFILAGRSIGGTTAHILRCHILPHVVSLMIVYMTLGIASAIILEASLSFVGVGIQPPTPSWGNMISEGQQYYRSAPWMVVWPGLAIMVTVLGFNLFGDGVRDALDPQQRHR